MRPVRDLSFVVTLELAVRPVVRNFTRHSQGSVGVPHGLKDCRASDAKSTNVRTADVDRRLICEHVRKPLYGPRPLIFDRTTSTVEVNSLRHPQGDPAIATVFGRELPANSPHGGRMPNVTRA